MKGSARPFGTILTAAFIMAAFAIAPVTAVSEDTMKLNFEQWIVKDPHLTKFPVYSDTKLTKELATSSLIWSADSDDLTGEAPFCVRFAASGSGGSWDFGDKCYSGEQYHIHTYKTPGTYTATYTPKTGESEKVTITVTEPKEAEKEAEKETKFLGLF